MPQLEWEELDFLECLEVVPETEEYGTYFSYRIEKVAHTLLLTVRPYDSVVQLSLTVASSETRLTEVALVV
ncbi:MAG: hypothetical protein K0Q72_40, partial [Armatimonadetes bacterium]|nr:hypothetical protein [Armatimonadota bacterium]